MTELLSQHFVKKIEEIEPCCDSKTSFNFWVLFVYYGFVIPLILETFPVKAVELKFQRDKIIEILRN